jgi:glyoxylase-like metal-dependent hydrolase (beta-lactamase superfamily II)
MLPQFRVISIGTLDAHPLWHDAAPSRTGHATTTLISLGDEHVLVNPSLPAQALAARMSERTPVAIDSVTAVFMTSFQPDHRRGLRLFDAARWLLHEPERQAAAAAFRDSRSEAEEAGDEELVGHYDRELGLLERCEVADDSLMSKVDLFPLPGVTPGTCGLLIALPARTVLIAGDAVATIEHLEQGKVLPSCASLVQAQESFKEAIEIADVLIPGRDNIMLNPMRQV